MNKFLSIYFLLFSSVACAMHFSEIEGKYDCPDIHNSMECARSIEGKLAKKYPFIQRVTEKSLLVVLPIHGERRFNDGEVAYSVIEYVEEFGYLIFSRQYWEGSGYSLLNLNTGSLQKLTGYPLFSPDGKYAVVVNQDLDAGYSANALQVFNASSSWELVFDAKPEQWGPGEVKWLNEVTVSFEKTMISENYDPFSDNKALRERYSREPAFLKKVGSNWEITLNKSSKKDAPKRASS